MAGASFFSKAAISLGGAGMLTSGNANLLVKHGTSLQREVFAKNEFSGRFHGTMCLSEPQAGSSLSDIATRATPDGDGFIPEARVATHPPRLANEKFVLFQDTHGLFIVKPFSYKDKLFFFFCYLFI